VRAMIVAAIVGGLFCAAHVSHAERAACATGASVFQGSGAAVVSPAACLQARASL
jgi:hypothetical protein